jgi:hypothetical protein
MNNRIGAVLLPVLALVALWLVVPVTAMAQEQMMDGGSGDPLGIPHYVIKVTPTLAYVDIGAAAGSATGQTYVVLREQAGLYVTVAKVRIVRVFDSFSIAETFLVEPGEEVDMLQRVVMAELWEAAAPSLDAGRMAKKPQAKRPMGTRTRSVLIFGGIDAGKDADLLYVNDFLSSADEVSGGAVGLRLSKVVAAKWRLALTYRISGEPFAGDADVTQLSIEVDGHYLLRGMGKAGPYVGLGAGMHQLAWDSTGNLEDTAYKMGFNLVGGLEVPVAGGASSLLLEGGYQHVMDWNDTIDVSNLRAFAGFAVNF